MKKRIFVILAIIIVMTILIIITSLPHKRHISKSIKEEVKPQLLNIEEEKDLLKAKAILQENLDKANKPEVMEALKKKLEEVNMKILFSPLIDECSQEYIVQSKDNLTKIAKKFNTTVELIRRANSLTSDTIMPGQKLKVNVCKFSLAVDKSLNLLFLKRNGVVLKTYIVSTGKDNSTPIGTFKIVNKLENPTWFKTGAVVPPGSPDNILGTRWMGLNIIGYGIHGSKDENEIGKQVTQGCVRMYNKDVEELYDIIPLGTEVEIVD
ncbi:MAG: L,D-transpeptidase family protein [Candidatus Omnitrophica bacterium]|nr:L,D-transpeptidase family protein [Candidatus Omnitrophota bacterium]